jgi:hypothetical protein
MPLWISSAAPHARRAWSSKATGAPNTAMIPSPVNLSTVPPRCCTTPVARLTSPAMISRSRSAPTAEAMSIERTTSANRTVTCLYSAGVVAVATAAPHSLQNFEFGGSSVPHDPHTKAAAVMSRGQPTVVPRHYRVTAGRPACAISPLRSGQRVARHTAPRGGGLGADSADVRGRSASVCEMLRGCPLLRPLLLRGW